MTAAEGTRNNFETLKLAAALHGRHFDFGVAGMSGIHRAVLERPQPVRRRPVERHHRGHQTKAAEGTAAAAAAAAAARSSIRFSPTR